MDETTWSAAFIGYLQESRRLLPSADPINPLLTKMVPVDHRCLGFLPLSFVVLLLLLQQFGLLFWFFAMIFTCYDLDGLAMIWNSSMGPKMPTNIHRTNF
jgi:hypothetical protein